jgi:hypothetical protein
MKEISGIITNEEFQFLYAKSKRIYHSLVVIDHFCSNYNEIEEIANISGIINFIKNEADMLYSKMINCELD